MKRNNIAFIGAGFQATTNIFPAAIEAGITVTALATRNIEKSQDALTRLGSNGAAYGDYNVMLQEQTIEGVIIVAQPKDQYEIALSCLKRGKHIFVEKPLGWNEKEAVLIQQAAIANNVKVAVGFMKRFAPSYLKVKELIHTKELGEVRSFYLNFCVDGTPFCPDEEAFLKLAAIHVLDLAIYLFGPIDHVEVMNNSNGASVNLAIAVRAKSGVVGSFNLSSMSAWSRESENLTVTFDDGFVQVEEINKVIVHRSKKDSGASFASLTESDEIHTPSMTPMSGSVRDLYLRGFVGELAHFKKSLSDLLSIENDGSQNILTMALCDLIMSKI
ncbi:Gfo/Idh/MocA family protein [Flavobacterium sp. 14A]|uniref:Gfo/Idh/MocA family protein n=1 Tax=Flavobacterium sp. 14A TaxID=2735896 RepID=UPI00156FBF5F|nr:Gfo/Idh/MocA family oxidoreductase [Flavobacterium sp. 14A]NRT11314.1 putative dehydrogenase [Flavobacterium sp. 14A]